MLVVFYEPETAVGLGGKPNRDFARRLAGRGVACLSIGFDPRTLDPSAWEPPMQPLAYLAHVASNALTAMQALPEGSMDDWVKMAYDDVPQRLWPVAKRSMLAHVEHLQSLGGFNA